MKNVRLAFFNFFTFVSIGCVISQLIPLINEAGYSPFEKSLILGIGALFSFVISLWLGKKSDSEGRIKPSFYISMILYLSCLILFYFFKSLFFKAMFLSGMIGASRTLMSSCETLILVNRPKHFEKYQCMGALGLISGSLIAGKMMLSGKVILCLVSLLISMLLIFKWPEKKKDIVEIHLSDMKLLLKNKEYLGYVLIFFFLMLMGFADQYIVVDKMVELKASSQLISLKYALQALMEIPLYLGMRRLFKKVSLSHLMIFTILMSGLKFALYGFVSEVNLILIVSLLQIVTHPIIVVLSKKLIAQCTPENLMASSQIIGFAVYFGISGFVAAIVGQKLSQMFSYDSALYIFSSFALFPLLIWYFMRKYVKVENGDENENISD